ncbi:glutathione peroxidase [Paenibacillus sacheonensis]|uniref:Glutathione peroxidase n=1 Tax=Paenibacillus sacheonensis TaxID=742054 RepID=A0A7X4YQD2_9BACL|nr:glutathione peroxidase [Paenibacillus sacheonensis]MBM7566352.1 glutathione peroxidase [Paenibacillus sacheonensis]NBC70555.1 redoxin domain-containing protein [Paenibacillus sacheonensis]
MSIYDFEVRTVRGEAKSLREYEGKVLLIVNTASNCMFASQYKELQELYAKYKPEGLEILGFPTNQFGSGEKRTNEDIHSFCEINFGVSFPLFEKTEVNGDNAHPLFRHLKKAAPGVLGSKSIKWNFTKFLVDRSGNVLKRFGSAEKPSDMEKVVADLL